jgi:predicted transcriptional regulator
MDLSHPFRVVTRTLDGDVLQVLSQGDAAQTGRAIQRRVGASNRGVQLALERLVSQGIVERRGAGSAYLYTLNRNHLAAKYVEGIAFLRLQLIDRLRSVFPNWTIQPAAAALFGSVATGEADSASDIDLLVIRPAGWPAGEPRWQDQLNALPSLVSSWTGNDTRILEYGEEEVRHAPQEEPVLESALRDGLELFGSLRQLRPRRRR